MHVWTTNLVLTFRLKQKQFSSSFVQFRQRLRLACGVQGASLGALGLERRGGGPEGPPRWFPLPLGLSEPLGLTWKCGEALSS